MSRNLRQYAAQTETRLIFGGQLLEVIVGVALIYLFIGPDAAWFGLLCMVVGLAPLVLIWFALLLVGWLARRAGGE